MVFIEICPLARNFDVRRDAKYIIAKNARV